MVTKEVAEEAGGLKALTPTSTCVLIEGVLAETPPGTKQKASAAVRGEPAGRSGGGAEQQRMRTAVAGTLQDGLDAGGGGAGGKLAGCSGRFARNLSAAREGREWWMSAALPGSRGPRLP